MKIPKIKLEHPRIYSILKVFSWHRTSENHAESINWHIYKFWQAPVVERTAAMDWLMQKAVDDLGQVGYYFCMHRIALKNLKVIKNVFLITGSIPHDQKPQTAPHQPSAPYDPAHKVTTGHVQSQGRNFVLMYRIFSNLLFKNLHQIHRISVRNDLNWKVQRLEIPFEWSISIFSYYFSDWIKKKKEL